MVAWTRGRTDILMSSAATICSYVIMRVMIVIAMLFTMSGILSIGACGSESENASAPPSSPPPASTVTAKIMPLGDSITASNTGQHSYRFYLWHLLLDKGYHVDFVGSLHGVGNGPPVDPNFDQDHEGHAGFRAEQILTQVHGWATKSSPDFVLLHIGTNDLCQEQSVESTVSDVEGIIDALRAVNPRVGILLAQLIASTSCNTNIPAFNARLSTVGAAKTSSESPIVLVDQYTGFNPATMTWDGLHPNAIGESRMADRWFEKLGPMLDAFAATSRP